MKLGRIFYNFEGTFVAPNVGAEKAEVVRDLLVCARPATARFIRLMEDAGIAI